MMFAQVMPPGTTAMLRARRKDANVKPNRVLDRHSSKGMIYENEELRLRTININAEVERGQSDIKKLRRENEQLRREIWSLREECDRLEALLRQKELEDEEGEEEDDEAEEEELLEKGKRDWVRRGTNQSDGLSVVAEEPEDALLAGTQPLTQELENPERQCEEFTGTLPPCLRVNCVHPYTAACTIDPEVLPALTVWEVIEAACPVVGEGLVGVRLVSGGGCFFSLRGREELESLLERGLVLREAHRLELQDISQGTVVIALSGVPHDMSDNKLVHTVSQFGPVIGYIESRYYRNVDTGERLARLRPQSSFPKRLYIEGNEISLRILPHEELAELAKLPSNINRTNLQIKVQSKPLPIETSATGPGTSASAQVQPFTFPTPSTSGQTQNSANKDDSDRSQSLPPGNSAPTTPSPGSVRRGASETEVGGNRRVRYRTSRRGRSPSLDSPNKARRKSSAGSTATRRSTCADLAEAAGTGSERERSNSAGSRSSLRRKLSVTGRENGKLPWCGCWGIGCV